MVSVSLAKAFTDRNFIRKVKNRLPHLFQIAELESSRAGKIGMEVGSVREKVLIGLLINWFGKQNVETEIRITEPEVDVRLFGDPISIKTITGPGGVKIVWTVDAQKTREFRDSYFPKCDQLLAVIKWNGVGGLYHIPLEVQQRLFRTIGCDRFIKLPKEGTNPRGVEYSREALGKLLVDQETRNIRIEWRKISTDFDPYRRWADYWGQT